MYEDKGKGRCEELDAKKSRRDDMIIEKHNKISNPEGVKYHRNSENMPFYGVKNNCIPICYNSDIPSGLKNHF